MMGAIEGAVIRNTTTKAISVSGDYGGGGLLANTEHCFLTLKNNRIAVVGKPNVLNQRELIINSLSVAIKDNGSSGDSLRILLYKNATTTDDKTFELVDTLMSYSETLTEIDSGQEGKRIGSYAISTNSDLTIDLTPLRIILTPLETLSVALISVNKIISQSMAVNFEVE